VEERQTPGSSEPRQQCCASGARDFTLRSSTSRIFQALIRSPTWHDPGVLATRKGWYSA
jgi:hypothetical protein